MHIEPICRNQFIQAGDYIFNLRLVHNLMGITTMHKRHQIFALAILLAWSAFSEPTTLKKQAFNIDPSLGYADAHVSPCEPLLAMRFAENTCFYKHFPEHDLWMNLGCIRHINSEEINVNRLITLDPPTWYTSNDGACVFSPFTCLKKGFAIREHCVITVDLDWRKAAAAVQQYKERLLSEISNRNGPEGPEMVLESSPDGSSKVIGTYTDIYVLDVKTGRKKFLTELGVYPGFRSYCHACYSVDGDWLLLYLSDGPDGERGDIKDLYLYSTKSGGIKLIDAQVNTKRVSVQTWFDNNWFVYAKEQQLIFCKPTSVF